MDIDTFKQRYSTELDGLTPARITTLWKKSKTLSSSELIDAIGHSRAAQDKQKRGKDIALVMQPVCVTTNIELGKSSAVHTSIDTPTPNEWSETCARIGIDYGLLLSKVKSLHSRTRRIDELHSAVSDLLALRELKGESIDVLQALG